MMARGRSTFRQRDLTAAVKAAKAGGLKIARIDVKGDGFSLIPGEADPPTLAAREHLDNVIDKLKRAQQKR